MNGGIIRMSQAELDVCMERRRQQLVEGYTAAHDDQHSVHELAEAAACYAITREESNQGTCPGLWPWHWQAWKPKDRRRNLVRAAALAIAAIERFDRGAAKASDA